MTADPATNTICSVVQDGGGGQQRQQGHQSAGRTAGQGGAREFGQELGGSRARGSPGSDARRTAKSGTTRQGKAEGAIRAANGR
jgi:hypothetical protein